ncbi:MAG: hypothetical protein JJT85_01380 [Chromatiales bacterium]|nr:hypothetical protein [Chromatiales bacterium]
MNRTLALAAAATAVFASAPAAATMLSANWYTLATGHTDTNVSIPGLTTGLVETTLGPNGLPVRSAFSASQPASSSNNIKDIDAGTNEILWWVPGDRAAGTVTVDASYPSTIALPFNQPSNLFPGGAGSNGGNNGFLTAHLFGLFDTPAGGQIEISIGADDDAWVFINGELVVDLGGVKPLATAPFTIADLDPGTNRIDVFFADRNTVQSGLVLSADVVFRPVPVSEPAALGLLGLGLFAFGLLALRRTAVAAKGA